MFPHVHSPAHLTTEDTITNTALELPAWAGLATAVVLFQFLLRSEESSTGNTGKLSAVSLDVDVEISLPEECLGALLTLMRSLISVSLLMSLLG